jgi:membrane-bound lytic murein transglycosylase
MTKLISVLFLGLLIFSGCKVLTISELKEAKQALQKVELKCQEAELKRQEAEVYCRKAEWARKEAKRDRQEAKREYQEAQQKIEHSAAKRKRRIFEWKCQEAGRMQRLTLKMTKEQVITLYGYPNRVNRSIGSWGVYDQWTYSLDFGSIKYLHFENEKLVSWSG